MADVGAGSVIGAGSVVTSPIPAGVTAAGVPARVLHIRAEAPGNMAAAR
jgi:acetyltransferase-like isoleucine patch superfamily enzyme